MSSTTNMDGKSIIAQDGANVNPFAELLRAYETAYASGMDYTRELLELATATAQSVLKKCVDPQRKTATERQTVSNTGLSPALTAVKRGIVADLAHLANLQDATNRATEWKFNRDGEIITEVVDRDANRASGELIGETLSDGLDMVNTAVVAILEQSLEHFDTGENWMEKPYTLRRLSRHVVIKSGDGAKWEEVETTPIQEVYRAVRREVQNSRAMQTDPRNGYLYIEDTVADPDSDKMETIYHRLHKWADLGGHTQDGTYTADRQTLLDYEEVVNRLNLTERQATIIKLRMSGYGYMAIGTYLGITQNSVYTQLLRIRKRCEAIGFTPGMWADMTDNNIIFDKL